MSEKKLTTEKASRRSLVMKSIEYLVVVWMLKVKNKLDFNWALKVTGS